MQCVVREEARDDADAVHRVNVDAFARPDEARLVDALRAGGGVLLSLVAEVEGRVAGHVLYSPVVLGGGSASLEGAALGPMAVLPELQRSGVGARLIREGTRHLGARGLPFVVVLGHPDYYPRFGFVPASRYGVRCAWDVPDEAFLLLPLDAARLRTVSGLARYRDEFSRVA